MTDIVLATTDASVDVGVLADVAGRFGMSGVLLSVEQAGLSGTGVSVVGISLPRISAQWGDECVEEIARAKIEVAAAVSRGVQFVCVRTATGPTVALEHVAEVFAHVCSDVLSAGVNVCVGNENGTRIEQPEDWHRLLAEVGAKNLLVDVDIAELHRSCVNPCDAFWSFEGRVGCVRLGNVDGGLPASLRDGEIDVSAVIGAMGKVGYGGPVVLPMGDDPCAMARFADDVSFLSEAGLPSP